MHRQIMDLNKSFSRDNPRRVCHFISYNFVLDSPRNATYILSYICMCLYPSLRARVCVYVVTHLSYIFVTLKKLLFLITA